jgi:acyl-coenzyme A synthetase/AMP-(fatty) acid ligase
VNVARPVLHYGRTRAARPALVAGERTVTYGELADAIARTAGHLAAGGIRPGDRLGICLGDGPDHLIALLGAAQCGAAGVSLDWRAPPAETGRLIDGLDLTCVLTDRLARDVTNRPSVVLDADWFRALERTDPIRDSRARLDDPFVISASSGSTGAPKFTLMTHGQYYFAAAGMWELMDLAGSHRYLCNLPLYYSGARNSALAHLLRGDTVVFGPAVSSAGEFVQLIERLDISVAVAVPSMVRKLLGLAGNAPLLPRIGALFCTGAPLYADELRSALERLTPNFFARYGTAETLAISVLRPADFERHRESVGQSHSLLEIEIVDEAGRPLPANAPGKVRLRGPGVATPLPGTAAEANFRDGWFYPGEIGRVDAEGYIYLHGRTSDVIMRSGAKFFPAEVEAALAEHAGVIESAVIGRRRPDHEEDAVAFVVGRAGLRLGDLIAHCRGRLTPHKVPAAFHFVDTLPRNTAGKIDKAALGRQLERETG